MEIVEKLILDTLDDEDFQKVGKVLCDLEDSVRGEYFRKIYQHLEFIYISGDRGRHSRIKNGINETVLGMDELAKSHSFKKYECLVPSSEEGLEGSRKYLSEQLPTIESSWIALIIGGPIGRDPVWVREVFERHKRKLNPGQSKILEKFLISEKVGFWLNPPKNAPYEKKGLSLENQNKKVLKIGVMISGQMRGYEAAFETWTKVFQGHDIDYYISTWKLNGSSGKPDHLVNEQKRFYFGEFSDEISSLLNVEGSIDLDAFISEIKPKKEILKEDLIRVYGDKCKILIEDESKFKFLTTNPQKMYYKIESAYDMIDDPRQYDLLVRIRPDIVMEKEKGGDINLLQSIFNLSEDRRAICTGYGYNYAYYGFGIDDKFAVGTPDLMSSYCKTWTNSSESKESLAGHESLASNLFSNRIDCIGTSGILNYRFAENKQITREVFDRILGG